MALGLAANPDNPDVTTNTIVMKFLSKDVAVGSSPVGSGNITLTDSEANYAQLEFTGTLVANISVIVPDEAKIYHVSNAIAATSPQYTLTVKTSGGTGIAVGQGTRAIVGSDGTNVERYSADV